jgi:hypothetical protein
MKNIKLTFILMLFGFKLFAQIDFPQDVIAKNGIVKASKYLVMSKKNPYRSDMSSTIAQICNLCPQR